MQRIDQGMRRAGLSMVESLVAVTVTAVAGAAALGSLIGTLRTTDELARQSVAYGLAEQMMNEIAARRFPDGIDAPTTGPGRTDFDDYDDYDDWSSRPPTTRDGIVVGHDGSSALGVTIRPPEMLPEMGLLERLTRRVEVQRVVPTADGGWSPIAGESDYRLITVSVDYTDALGQTSTIAQLQRVFTNVATAP